MKNLKTGRDFNFSLTSHMFLSLHQMEENICFTEAALNRNQPIRPDILVQQSRKGRSQASFFQDAIFDEVRHEKAMDEGGFLVLISSKTRPLATDEVESARVGIFSLNQSSPDLSFQVISNEIRHHGLCS